MVWVFANHDPDHKYMTQGRIKVHEVPPMPAGKVQPFVRYRFSTGRALSRADCEARAAAAAAQHTGLVVPDS